MAEVPADVRTSDVRWLTPRAWKVWRDVGLRGMPTGGTRRWSICSTAVGCRAGRPGRCWSPNFPGSATSGSTRHVWQPLRPNRRRRGLRRGPRRIKDFETLDQVALFAHFHAQRPDCARLRDVSSKSVQQTSESCERSQNDAHGRHGGLGTSPQTVGPVGRLTAGGSAAAITPTTAPKSSATSMSRKITRPWRSRE